MPDSKQFYCSKDGYRVEQHILPDNRKVWFCPSCGHLVTAVRSTPKSKAS